MCGRYALDAPRSQLSRRFALDECVELSARYNIAPASDVAVIRQSPEGQRVLHQLRWGLLPHWTKDPAIAARLINARRVRGRARSFEADVAQMLAGQGEKV